MGVRAVVVLLLLGLAAPAQAAPSARMAIGPLTTTSPTPGQTVTATIRLSDCAAQAIRLTSDRPYVDYRGQQHPYPAVDARPTSDPAVWTAPVTVPADADGYGELDLTAAITCAAGSTTATGRVIFRSFQPPRVRVTPFAVRRGQPTTLVVSPCHGGLQDHFGGGRRPFRFIDSGTRERPTNGATVVRTGPTGYRISYVMDPYALTGYGTFRILCAQNLEAAVRVSVLPAGAPAASSSPTPAAPTPSPTASPSPSVSASASPTASPGALVPVSGSSRLSTWVVLLTAVVVAAGGSLLVRRVL